MKNFLKNDIILEDTLKMRNNKFTVTSMKFSKHLNKHFDLFQ